MPEILERKMDRYLRGELTPAEARELAHAALSDSALFDALAAHSAMEQSLQDPAFRAAVLAPTKVVRFPRKVWGIGMAALAAAIAVFELYINSRRQAPHTLAGTPILIAKDFAPSSSTSAPVFRAAPADSRAPQPEGTIVAQDNLLVTINLGSLDGLTTGIQLNVLRTGSKNPTGRLEATTIFRDRSRARIVSGAAHEHDRVRAEPSVYLNAVAEVMGSDLKVAHNAVQWAQSNAVPPSAMRPLLERLAPLDYTDADFSAADRDYQLLRDSAPTPDERAEALNNLGAIADQRGQISMALEFYQQALRTVANSAHDRQIIEANLARLTGGGVEKH